MSIHKDHRKRMRDRFRKEGLDHFDERHVLELLLCFAIPRIDTAPAARALLDRFGSFSQVLEAPVEELEKVEGIGEHASTLITLVNAIGRYYLIDRTKNQSGVLTTTGECGRYLSNFFYGRRNETVYILCLDAKCKVLGCREVGEGSVNSANVPIRRVVEMALAMNATTVVLGHNHPSGLALPSNEDVLTTRRLAAALSTVDITLADHIVVADGDFVSMAESGLYQPGTCQMIV